MIVCVCRRVSDREIARHAHAGMSFDEIQFELGIAMQCGRCESCARDVVAQCCASQPVAAIHNEVAAQTVPDDITARIKKEATTGSQVADDIFRLTDAFGPRFGWRFTSRSIQVRRGLS